VISGVDERENEGDLYGYLVGVDSKGSLGEVDVGIRVILPGKECCPNAEVELDNVPGGVGVKDEFNSREERFPRSKP
jgi:hypothetical protein